MIPVDDRGLLLGDGLFETVLWRSPTLVDFDRHVERMRAGCVVLGLPEPERDTLLAAATRALSEMKGPEYVRAAVRLTYTAGSGGRGLDRPAEVQPLLIAKAFSAPVISRPTTLATATTRRNETSPTSRIKSLAYLDNVLARREAQAVGAEDALMLNTRGEVACAAVANIFWFEGERLCTPALACGVLDGTVRARVLEQARTMGVETAEVAQPRAALDTASGLFLTNSLIGVRQVAELDGVAVTPNPLFEPLRVLDACVV